MRASKFFISTLKNAPSDAEIISHKLMVRAGIIKQLSAGIYTYMPIGLRIIRKVENIIRQEMNRIGAVELLMPIMQPAELWQETNRLDKMGAELIRIKDRHGRHFIMQPTAEEIITDLARTELRSYKQLPIILYHIQTKFRDERRPRFGLIRSREFIMKDAYSFDRDIKSLNKSYQNMCDTYIKIFNRFGLKFRVVIADNGEIGGSYSHEFHIIAASGENTIAYCPTSNYAANIEAAEALPICTVRHPPTTQLTSVFTSGKTQYKAVAELLNIPLTNIIKSIVLIVDTKQLIQKEIWLLLLRSDHELNEIKIKKIPALKNYHVANEDEIIELFGIQSSYIGPINTLKPIKIIADRTVITMSDFVCGANKINFHFTGVNWGRDLPEPLVADIRNVVAGDVSPDGQGILTIQQGIEIGHVFQLGTTYSHLMNAIFSDENNNQKFIYMGCYGIGITRILSATIEQNFDERGIIWPISLAPFSVVLCPIEYNRSEIVKLITDDLYTKFLQINIDIILDDRHKRSGVMFTDWELIGIPHRIVISNCTVSKGYVEYQERNSKTIFSILLTEILFFIQKKLTN